MTSATPTVQWRKTVAPKTLTCNAPGCKAPATAILACPSRCNFEDGVHLSCPSHSIEPSYQISLKRWLDVDDFSERQNIEAKPGGPELVRAIDVLIFGPAAPSIH
jgi:hypothetical protein